MFFDRFDSATKFSNTNPNIIRLSLLFLSVPTTESHHQLNTSQNSPRHLQPFQEFETHLQPPIEHICYPFNSFLYAPNT